MSMKRLQEMTEEEVFEHAETAIRDYLSYIRPHGEFLLEECISRQVGELKMLFRWHRGLGRRDALSIRDVQDLNAIVSRYLPRLQERAREAQLRYTKEQTLWKIRSTAAAELIRKAFDDAGLKTEIECQRFRAKVFVNLGRNRLRFYVGFKALEKGDKLPGIVRAVLDLKNAAERIGGDVRIGRQ